MGEITPGDWFWDSYSKVCACVPEGHPLDFFPGKENENSEGLKPVNIAYVEGGPGQRGHGDELILDEAKANAYFISRAPEIVRWLMTMLAIEWRVRQLNSAT